MSIYVTINMFCPIGMRRIPESAGYWKTGLRIVFFDAEEPAVGYGRNVTHSLVGLAFLFTYIIAKNISKEAIKGVAFHNLS